MAEPKKLKWEVVKDITDPETGFTLRISRNNMTPPGYSAREGNKPTDGTADDRIRPFNKIEVNWKTDPPTVVSQRDLRNRLHDEADLWVKADTARIAAARRQR